jgi:hypothetical protein
MQQMRPGGINVFGIVSHLYGLYSIAMRTWLGSVWREINGCDLTNIAMITVYAYSVCSKIYLQMPQIRQHRTYGRSGVPHGMFPSTDQNRETGRVSPRVNQRKKEVWLTTISMVLICTFDWPPGAFKSFFSSSSRSSLARDYDVKGRAHG